MHKEYGATSAAVFQSLGVACLMDGSYDNGTASDWENVLEPDNVIVAIIAYLRW